MGIRKREIDHRLATHFHPAALSAQIAEVGQTEGRSQAKLLLKGVAVVGVAELDKCTRGRVEKRDFVTSALCAARLYLRSLSNPQHANMDKRLSKFHGI